MLPRSPFDPLSPPPARLTRPAPLSPRTGTAMDGGFSFLDHEHAGFFFDCYRALHLDNMSFFCCGEPRGKKAAPRHTHLCMTDWMWGVPRNAYRHTCLTHPRMLP